MGGPPANGSDAHDPVDESELVSDDDAASAEGETDTVVDDEGDSTDDW